MTSDPTVFRIGHRLVGDERTCFVIAEAGVNHNGDLALAHQLIDVAATAGADAVKFQTFRAALVASHSAPTAEYQVTAGSGGDQREMLTRLELDSGAWIELIDHARHRGLVFLSTAFDLDSLDLLVSLGVGVLKIPSGELDNVGYLRAHAERGLPLIVSTGMASLDEVDRAVEVLSAASGPISLLHCVSAYPAPREEANLRAIPAMAERYQVPVGWSDHTAGPTCAVAAVALGATIIERHITTDRNLPGPDHTASDDPAAFADYVDLIRTTSQALGDGAKRPAPSEVATRDLVRRSFHAALDLPAGHVLSPADVVALRPATGVPVSETVEGLAMCRAVEAGSPIRWEDLVR